VLVATEAWLAADRNGTSTVYRVTRRAIACGGPAPCSELHQAKLNSTLSQEIQSVDLSTAVATDEQRAAALMALDEGILLSGQDRTTVLDGRETTTLSAVDFYARLRPR